MGLLGLDLDIRIRIECNSALPLGRWVAMFRLFRGGTGRLILKETYFLDRLEPLGMVFCLHVIKTLSLHLPQPSRRRSDVFQF
jgi:hypothetical protein